MYIPEARYFFCVYFSCFSMILTFGDTVLLVVNKEKPFKCETAAKRES